MVRIELSVLSQFLPADVPLGILHYIPTSQYRSYCLRVILQLNHRKMYMPVVWQQSPAKLASANDALGEAVKLT